MSIQRAVIYILYVCTCVYIGRPSLSTVDDDTCLYPVIFNHRLNLLDWWRVKMHAPSDLRRDTNVILIDRLIIETYT